MFANGCSHKKKHRSLHQPSTVSLLPAIKHTLRNKNFRIFVVADFSYFMAVTIIIIRPYVLRKRTSWAESIGNKLMITMVPVSFVFLSGG